MVEQTDVVVVGGGIVGTATAFHLAEKSVDTVLVDGNKKGRATHAGAGIVSPSTSSRRADEDWFAFAIEAANHYPDLIRRIQTQGIDDHGYRETNLLSVAVDEADVEALETDLERIARRTGPDGASDERIEEVDPEDAAEAFPALADAERVLKVENAARVDGERFTGGLRRAARRTGLSTFEGTVEEVLVEDGAVSGVVVDAHGGVSREQQRTAGGSERIEADHVVIAGGAWSAAFGDDLGLELPVEPVRGQILHLDAGGAFEPPVEDWPIVVGYDDNYLVPWPDDRVVVGATREEGVGFDPRVTAGGVDDVLTAGLRLAPGLADATFEEVRVGLRPGSPDGLPMLGPVPDVDGAFVATGHGPTGLTLGPFSGKIVAELVRGNEPDVDISAFAPDRF